MTIEAEGVTACVVVGSFDTLLDHLEGIARSFAPDEIKPGKLREQIGQGLGDPSLKSLDPKKPLVLWVLEPKGPGEMPAVTLQVPVKDPAPLEAGLQAAGLQVKTEEGLLGASTTPEGLAAAKKLLPAYQRIEKNLPGADARIYLRVSRLAKTYGPMIEGFAGMIAAQVSAFTPPPAAGDDPAGAPRPPMDLGAILKVEAKVLLAALRQIREFQCDLTLNSSAVTAETTLAAEPGSGFEALFATPGNVPPPPAFVIDAAGPMVGSFQFDPRNLETGTRKFLEDLAKDPEIGSWLKPEIIGTFTDFSRLATGSYVFNFQPSPKAGMGASMAFGIKDEKSYLDMMEKLLALFAPEAPLGKLYSSMGIPITAALEKNVREHAGAKVHRVKMRPANPDSKKSPQDAWKAMITDQEFSVVKGLLLLANDPASLDRMLDRAAAGGTEGSLPLKAVKTFGPGRLGYLDYEIIGYLKGIYLMGISAFLPNSPEAGLFAKAKPGEPMAIALTAGEGRSLIQLSVPLEPFREFSRAFKAGAPPPAGAAEPAPEKKAKDR
jgi:hypothetical protein